MIGNVHKYPAERLERQVIGPRLSSFSKPRTSSQHRDVESGDANGTAEFLSIELTRAAHRNRITANNALAIAQSVDSRY
jgi:hypothetical protein